MTRTVRTAGAVAALVVLATLRPFAQTGTIKNDVLKDWTDLKATMVKISNEMPEDKFGYKSTPPQRSYGEQILHVAGANVGFLGALGGSAKAPMIDMKATKKADIIKSLEDSFDYGTALINEQTDQTMIGTVQARFLGASTRARVVYFLIGHAWDIYGQMAVYLRLNGHVPPASQRP
jgi:uncharacterized damage-inducible protein DinB